MRFMPGIGARLLAAFGLVSGLTILAASVAFLGFSRLGGVVNELGSRTLPAVDAAARIPRASASIAAAAPALLTARGPAEAAEMHHGIAATMKRLTADIAQLPAGTAAAATLGSLARETGESLAILEDFVATRLTLAAARPLRPYQRHRTDNRTRLIRQRS